MEESKFRYKINELAEEYKGKRVVIVGNGPTGQAYQWREEDEHVWTMDDGFRHTPQGSLIWVMDDLEGPALDANRNKEALIANFKKCPFPIMTTRRINDIPATVPYPLHEIAMRFQTGYFSDTLSYMIAWAILAGVKELNFHGCDYYPIDARARRACAEYWMGRAAEAGITTLVNPASHLTATPRLDNVNSHIRGFYGYTRDHFPLRTADENDEEVDFDGNPRPTADDVELAAAKSAQ